MGQPHTIVSNSNCSCCPSGKQVGGSGVSLLAGVHGPPPGKLCRGTGRPGDAGVEERALDRGSGLSLNSNNTSHVTFDISFIQLPYP